MHQPDQNGFHQRFIVVNSGITDIHQYWRQLGPGHKILPCLHDAFVRGAFGVVADEQFLVKLFARAKSSDFDFNIAVGTTLVAYAQARQLRHAPGQVNNLQRRAHVQHKHIATLSHGAGLQHQLRCLGNGHEIAGDLWVCDRQRPAITQLLAKQRHHAATAAQHVAKAHHGKYRLILNFCAVGAVWRHKTHRRAGRQRLKHQLGHAFGCAHDVGWANSLVSGNQHEMGCSAFHCRASSVQSAKHIVQHALGRITFNQRHMLVGRCVVHGSRPVQVTDFLEAAKIASAGQQGNHFNRQAALAAQAKQLRMNGVQRKFIEFNQHQPVRFFQRNLAAQLAANAAARPSHQHHLARQIAR